MNDISIPAASSPLDTQDIRLERIRLGVMARLSESLLDREVNVDVATHMAGSMVLRAFTDFAAERPRRETIEYPSSWWDYTKLSIRSSGLTPEWLKRRLHVTFKQIVFDPAIYYKYVSLPKEAHFIHVAKIESVRISKWGAPATGEDE